MISYALFLYLVPAIVTGITTLTPNGSVSVCVGNSVQFKCNGPMGVIAWYTTGVDGVPNQTANSAPGLDSLSRFSSPDSDNTVNPSRITLLNVVLSDEGAAIQCQGSDGSRSETTIVAVGRSICNFSLMATPLELNTTCGFNVFWTAPSCSSGLISEVEYDVTDTDNSDGSGDSSGSLDYTMNSFEVTDLSPDTSYNIMVTLKNDCGKGSSMTVSGTTIVGCKATSPPGEEELPTLPTGAIIGIVIAVLLIIIIIIVVVIVVVFLVLKKGDGARDVGASRSKSTEPIKQSEVKENEEGPKESENQLHYADLDHTRTAQNPRPVPANLESESVEYAGIAQA